MRCPKEQILPPFAIWFIGTETGLQVRQPIGFFFIHFLTVAYKLLFDAFVKCRQNTYSSVLHKGKKFVFLADIQQEFKNPVPDSMKTLRCLAGRLSLQKMNFANSVDVNIACPTWSTWKDFKRLFVWTLP